MIAILLCAGYATRMHPITRDFPKHLLPVAGRPAIDYTLEQIFDLRDIREVHVVTNAKFFHTFENWQQGWSKKLGREKVEIKIYNDGSDTNENRLGPAGDLRFVLEKIHRPSRILVAGGDNIFRFRLKPLWEHFLKSHHHYIIALSETDKDKLTHTGVPVFGRGDRVLRLYEKPKEPPSCWAHPQLYFFMPSVWSRLAEFHQKGQRRGEQAHFIDFLCRRENVYAFKLNASRLDIGTISSYYEADACLRSEPIYLEKASSPNIS